MIAIVRIVLTCALVLYAPVVPAHMAASGVWTYPQECCGGEDCQIVPASAVRVFSPGMYIVNEKYYIAIKDVRISPDGAYHACITNAQSVHGDRLWCLFVPAGV